MNNNYPNAQHGPGDRYLFGEGLKARRLALGYTQKEVATFLGVDPSVVVKDEKRAMPPLKRERITGYAEFYQTTPDKLLSHAFPNYETGDAQSANSPALSSPDDKEQHDNPREAWKQIVASLEVLFREKPESLVEVARLALERHRQYKDMASLGK